MTCAKSVGHFCSRGGERRRRRPAPAAGRAWAFPLLGLVQGVFAAVYHVAPDGDDAHPGSPERPLRTVQRAVDRARAGDTIVVRAGVYREAVVLRESGEEGRPIVLKNHPGERPILQPGQPGQAPPGQGIRLQARAGYQHPIGWIALEGLEIRHGHDGIKFYNAHHVTIRNCFVHDNWHQGILGNGYRVRIEGNVIARNGLRPDNERSNLEHGIYVTGTEIEIVNNVIHGNRAYGIQVAGYPYNPGAHAGPEFAGARRWRIHHNTIALQRNRAGVVLWQPQTTDCTIQNNIFYRNAQTLGRGACQGVDFVNAGGGHRICRNLFFGPERTAWSQPPEGCRIEENLEGQDPLFMDADRGDFRLRAGSPAIDAGLTEGAPKKDREGRTRPQGGGVDLGAHEFQRGL
jgi:hypothetical protein